MVIIIDFAKASPRGLFGALMTNLTSAFCIMLEYGRLRSFRTLTAHTHPIVSHRPEARFLDESVLFSADAEGSKEQNEAPSFFAHVPYVPYVPGSAKAFHFAGLSFSLGAADINTLYSYNINVSVRRNVCVSVHTYFEAFQAAFHANEDKEDAPLP